MRAMLFNGARRAIPIIEALIMTENQCMTRMTVIHLALSALPTRQHPSHRPFEQSQYKPQSLNQRGTNMGVFLMNADGEQLALSIILAKPVSESSKDATSMRTTQTLLRLTLTYLSTTRTNSLRVSKRDSKSGLG